jgi:hypothetical protein
MGHPGASFLEIDLCWRESLVSAVSQLPGVTRITSRIVARVGDGTATLS